MLTPIISQFSIPGTFIKAERFGAGLINDTYLCAFLEDGADRNYILQRINSAVFAHPEQVMQNVETVTTHIIERLTAEGVADPYAITPALISTRNKLTFYLDDRGAYWRMFHFIESGAVYDTVRDATHAYEVGRGVGRFQALVTDLLPAKLHDTLPGFHFTRKYYDEYEEAVGTDAKGRVSSTRAEMEFVEKRRPLATMLTDQMTAGTVPIRVVHNDPKVNNVMIQKETGEALCMLDLDTVKPGIVLFDFGDCVRSAANPAGEDATDLGSVRIDRGLLEAIAEGYLRETGEFLTKKERELLPVSVQVITFELGLRFLTDYFRGDTYFKVQYPTHNLHRARVQFRLLESIEEAGEKISLFISRL